MIDSYKKIDDLPWQKRYQQGFDTANKLLDYLGLPAPETHAEAEAEAEAEKQFKTRVPLSYVNKMQHGNPNDPLLLQVLAQAREMLRDAHFTNDPLHENTVNPLPGLIHKYASRVLVMLTQACAVHCRYCFRRHFPYDKNNPGQAGHADILDYIHKHPSVNEVILSGGDPMMISDKVLAQFLQQLSAITQVRTIRFHTRIPVVFPERIDNGFLKSLAQYPFHKIIVLHSNHPQEIDSTTQIACKKLKEAGCVLLNQSVLLKGINNTASVLQALSERLLDIGVLPYYLHILDKVSGTQHFDIPESEAIHLHEELQKALPGYLVPRLVREVPGMPHKTLVQR